MEHGLVFPTRLCVRLRCPISVGGKLSYLLMSLVSAEGHLLMISAHSKSAAMTNKAMY